MSRLVIVSNRVALPGEGAQRSGGLVTGLVDALHQAGALQMPIEERREVLRRNSITVWRETFLRILSG